MMIKRRLMLVAVIGMLTACGSGSDAPSKSEPAASPARFRVVLAVTPTMPQPAPIAPGPAGRPSQQPSSADPQPTRLTCPPSRRDAPADAPLEACSADGEFRYSLGPARLTARDISRVVLSQPQGGPLLTIYFTDTGQRAFTELTRQIVDRQLALEVDGVVLSAPVIRSVIEGEAELSGFDEQEASDLLERLGVGS